ncbi:MAG TPA: MBL fold metallo-hydrolase [Candidatus Eisenbergiella intestinipullorum]|nr:MBL fold metallo-hydrolase [Candidatus Eisenbergiella intestinipullorum]
MNRLHFLTSFFCGGLRSRHAARGLSARIPFGAALLLSCCLLLTGCSDAASWSGLLQETEGTDGQIPEGSMQESISDQALPSFSETDGYLKVHFLDVGQGDSILIQAGGQAMLVDAGTNESGSIVTDYLRSLNITRLDYLIGTHPHEDHIGGLDDVIRSFDIGTVILPDAVHTTQTYEDVLDALLEKGLTATAPRPKDVYPLGDASFTILSPSEQTAEEASETGDLNNLSVGIRLVYGSNAFVLCGDAESDSEEAMVQSGLTLKADVLKVGHHGSSTSTCSAFLAAVDPDYAVISCGKDNSYGHPHQETLDRLNAAGVSVFRTDLQGTVVAVSDGTNITWSSAPETEGASEPSGARTQEVYILNPNTMKFHRTDCSSVAQMKEENRIRFEGARDEVIGMGYSPCGQCEP